MNSWTALTQSGPVGTFLAWLLLTMSVASWVTMLWKGWQLRAALRDHPRAVAAFWQSATLAEGRERLASYDPQRWVLPLVDAALQPSAALASLGDGVPRLDRATRLIRAALHGIVQRLQRGQVLLATVGSTAPFVGLLGTVLGIHGALTSIASDGLLTIDKVAGPVGETLVMTAAGLAVALPAVIGYNLLGRWIATLEADLEGFAHDLCACVSTTHPASVG